MRFKIAGTTYSLIFHHSLPVDPNEELKMSYQLNSRDRFGETEAILYEIMGTKNEEKVEVCKGIAFCSPQDTYVKSVGRKVALEKMLASKSLDWMHDKGLRRLFWMIYFSKTSDLSEEMYVKHFTCPKVTYAYNGVTLKDTE